MSEEDLADLRERLERAERELKAMAEEPGTPLPRYRHLRSKAEGVGLALSYLREYDGACSHTCASKTHAGDRTWTHDRPGCTLTPQSPCPACWLGGGD